MEKSKADGSVDKKPRSRKHRRSTRNLQSSDAQKQRSCKWLETHLWHTKRMKMVNKYGYRLSEHCADKGVRAAYKSFTHGCLMSVSNAISQTAYPCLPVAVKICYSVNIIFIPGKIIGKISVFFCLP